MRQLTPFSGMQISLQDATFWTNETAAAIKQRINSDLYFPGVVNGLTVFESGTMPGAAAVASGVAYDSHGERMAPPVLQDLITYSGALLHDTSIYQVALRYVLGNDGTSGLDVNGVSNFRHALDSYTIVVAKQGADSLLPTDVVLTQLFSTAPGSSLIFNNSVRNVFSARYNAAGSSAQGSNLALGGSLSVGGCATFYSGIIILSPNGSKQALLSLDNTGNLALTPLNYVFS